MYATDGKIKKDSLPNGKIKTISRGSKPSSSSFVDSIAPITENVNNQFSLSNNSNGTSFTPKQPSTVGTPLRDLALAPTQEDIAPVAENATTTSEASQDYEAPAFKEASPMTEEEAGAMQDEQVNTQLMMCIIKEFKI